MGITTGMSCAAESTRHDHFEHQARTLICWLSKHQLHPDVGWTAIGTSERKRKLVYVACVDRNAVGQHVFWEDGVLIETMPTGCNPNASTAAG